MNLYKFRYIRTKADTVEADTAAALSSRKNRFFSDDTPIHYDHATFANSLTSLEGKRLTAWVEQGLEGSSSVITI